MRRYSLSGILLLGLSLGCRAASTITGYVQSSPTGVQAANPNVTSVTAGQVTDTGLTVGGCIQATPGTGLFTVTGLGCGTGGGGVGGGGTINNASQYSAGYYSFTGSSNVISGISPGTAGQYFTTQGAGSAPTWTTFVSTITPDGIGALSTSSATATYLQIINATNQYAPISGSANYIENGSVIQAATFNVTSGTVTGPFNATNINSPNGYSQNGVVVLNSPNTTNTFVGPLAGAAVTGGNHLTATGYKALNTETNAGYSTASGYESLFNENSSIGTNLFNSGYGTFSLFNTAAGQYNSGFGYSSCLTNTGGVENTCLGASADVGSGNLTNATAIGYGAIVSNSNTIQLGSGVNVITSTLTTTGEVCFKDATCQTTATGASNFIQNTSNLQAGATFYVSSGTVNGLFTASGGILTTNTTMQNEGTLSLSNIASNAASQLYNGGSSFQKVLDIQAADGIIVTTGSFTDVVGTVTFSTVTLQGKIVFPDGSVQTSAASAGSFIENQNTLQSGATFYVSSGTIAGPLYIQTSAGVPRFTLQDNGVSSFIGDNSFLNFSNADGSSNLMIMKASGTATSNGLNTPYLEVDSTIAIRGGDLVFKQRSGVTNNYVGFRSSQSVTNGTFWILPNSDNAGLWQSDGNKNLSLSNTVASSSLTVSNAGGLGVTYGVTVGSISWTAPLTQNVVFSNTSSYGVTGSTTNDTAAPFNVGESSRSYATNIAAATTGVRVNICSVVLSSGDWDVSGNAILLTGAGTFTAPNQVILSAFSGNTATDENAGDNASYFSINNAINSSYGTAVPAWRVSLASPTTIYLKGTVTYSVGSPTWDGRISARRAR